MTIPLDTPRRIKPLHDEYGVIREAVKVLPADLKLPFLDALAELEDNECHRTRTFPKTRLHKVQGAGKLQVFRADIDKIAGWRLHVQYGKYNALHLKDILSRQKHDVVMQAIEAKRYRYM